VRLQMLGIQAALGDSRTNPLQQNERRRAAHLVAKKLCMRCSLRQLPNLCKYSVMLVLPLNSYSGEPLAEWAGMGYAVKDEYDPLPDCANAPLKLVNMSGLTHQAGNLCRMACRHGSSICIRISLDPLKVETSWHPS